MATMYPLFLGILLTAVCSIVGTGNGIVIPIPENVIPTPTIPPLGVRGKIINIATAELGVEEATGNNDGPRIEKYLRYTDLGKGHAWCAAFVSWCFGQAGLPQPRNPWSPALFPNSKTYWRHNTPPLGAGGIQPADIFGIYGTAAKRINHVGLIKSASGKYLLTIEGNSNNRVESRRRHLSTIYALADWIEK